MLFKFQSKIDLFLDVLRQSKFGSIKVFYHNKCIFFHKGQSQGPKADIKIINKKCLNDFFLKGDIGWAESYVLGNWETSNLPDFLEWGARNFHEFSKYVRGKWYTLLYFKLKHILNSNNTSGSKKNISFHYDLGNAFYEKWLDSSMTYSSAMFKSSNDNLHQAQINKYENLAKITNIKPNEKILEIGCGWGEFSTFLAKKFKANVTAITISKKQYEKAKERIFNESLSDKVSVEMMDYRNVEGIYDKIVSIEMFEAVGRRNWSIYFKKLKECITDKGKIILQIITISEADYYYYSHRKDFIQKYVFPGGMLPTKSLLKSLAKKTI